MSTTGVGSTSWLNSYDPTDPSSLSGLLSSSPADPSQSSVPAGFDVLQPGSSRSSSTPASSSSSSGLSSYQQALDALTETSDTFLIQSALGQFSSASPPDSLSAALQAAEQEQLSEQSAGQTIDTTA